MKRFLRFTLFVLPWKFCQNLWIILSSAPSPFRAESIGGLLSVVLWSAQSSRMSSDPMRSTPQAKQTCRSKSGLMALTTESVWVFFFTVYLVKFSQLIKENSSGSSHFSWFLLRCFSTSTGVYLWWIKLTRLVKSLTSPEMLWNKLLEELHPASTHLEPPIKNSILTLHCWAERMCCRSHKRQRCRAAATWGHIILTEPQSAADTNRLEQTCSFTLVCSETCRCATISCNNW